MDLLKVYENLDYELEEIKKQNELLLKQNELIIKQIGFGFLSSR